MLERVSPAMSPDVLRYHATQMIRAAGYGERADSEQGFLWDREYAEWAEKHDKPVKWCEVARGRAPVLRYWYRESAESLSGISFHDDLLTLGLTTPDDPPEITSGMIYRRVGPAGTPARVSRHARSEAGRTGRGRQRWIGRRSFEPPISIRAA